MADGKQVIRCPGHDLGGMLAVIDHTSIIVACSNRDCKRFIKIKFSGQIDLTAMGVSVEMLPPRYHIDYEESPVCQRKHLKS